jgi:signal transduction histidine kinase
MTRYRKTVAFPAVAEHLESAKLVIHRFFADHLVDDEDVYHWELIIEELVANVIDHSFRGRPPGEVRVQIMLSDRRITATVDDDGPAFDPTRWNPAPVTALVQQGRKRGLGIQLIRLLADSIAYERLPEGCNRVTVIKALSRRLPDAAPPLTLPKLSVLHQIGTRELRSAVRGYLAAGGSRAIALPANPARYDRDLVRAAAVCCLEFSPPGDLRGLIDRLRKLNPEIRILICLPRPCSRSLGALWNLPVDGVFLEEWGQEGFLHQLEVLTGGINRETVCTRAMETSREQEARLTSLEERSARTLLKMTNLFQQTRDINLALDRRRIAENLLLSVMGEYGAAAAALFLAPEKGKGFTPACVKGRTVTGEWKIPARGGIARCFAGGDGSRSIESNALGGLAASEKKILSALDAALLVPLRGKGRLIGVLVVSGRFSGSGYSPEDQDFIQVLGTQAAVALENALLVEELKETLDYVRKQQDQIIASEKLAEVGRMAAGIAHEINNPLTAIIGLADNLLMAGGLDEKKAQRIEIILKEGERISQMTSNLLSFSRPKPPSMGPVPLGGLVADILLLLQYQLKKAKAELVTRFPDPVPTVTGDADKLKQVFINLIVNATHAMPEGGTITISISVIPGGKGRLAGKELVRIDVSDTGTGIPPEIRERIFEPFFTTKGEGKGTGLGLFITSDIIASHKGSIDVDSAPGRGTTFSIYLPRG